MHLTSVLIFLFIVAIRLNSFISFKFRTYAQTAFENSKIYKKVSTSRWTESLRRERLEVRQKVRTQKYFRDLNRDRSLPFNSVKNHSSELIISLYLRRSPFVQLRPKKASNRQFTIYGEWFYYKDILIQGDPVHRIISELQGLSSSGGIEEECIRMDFEALLREKIISLNSSDSSTSGRFTVQNAFEELLIMDPKVSSLLSSHNLEFGYSFKFQGKSNSLEERLLQINRPIFRLPDKEFRSSDQLLPFEAMDCLQSEYTTGERRELIRSTITDYYRNVLLTKAVKHLTIAVDGSAMFKKTLSGNYEICSSAGILLLPKSPSEKTTYRDDALLFNVFPIRGDFHRPLDAELIALISSVSLLIEILRNFLSSRNAIQDSLKVELISDCKSACKIFDDNERLLEDSPKLPELSSMDLVDILKLKQSQLRDITEELRSMGSNIHIACRWKRGHPELTEPIPSR